MGEAVPSAASAPQAGSGSSAQSPAKASPRQPEITPESIRAHLERVLASPVFAHAERLKRLLRYLVERALTGNGEKVKEYTVGVEAFDRDASFDPRIDPIVRVEVGRLRVKLKEYYRTEGGEDGLEIDLPKGSYAAVFVMREPAAAAGEAPAGAPATAGREDEGASPAIAVAANTWRRRFAVGVLASLVLVAALLALNVGGWADRLFGRPAWAHIQSVVILPLENLTGDPSQEYLVDGMTDALITELAQIRTLRVISRTSAMRYKGTRKPVQEIAKELNVDAIVEGTVVRSGNRLRVHAQLIQAATDRHLWARAYERDVGDIVTLDGELATAIAAGIKARLSPQDQARLARRHTESPEAFELYLKGRFFWSKRSPEGLAKAVEYLNQAIERDPKYAAAHAGLADCYALQGLDSKPGAMPRAKAAALQALALDDMLAEAHTSLAGVKALYDWDWAGAEQEFQRALELNPNYAPAHHWYAVLYLAPRGEQQKAYVEMHRALELDPLSPILITDLGWLYYLASNYDAALHEYQKALEMAPEFIPAHFRLQELYHRKQMYPQALVEYLTEMRILGDPRTATVERAYRRAGYAGVLQWFLAGEKQYKEEEGRWYFRASLHAALGEENLSLTELRRALDDHFPGLIYLRVDPRWDNLRSDPRFAELLRRIGLS